MAKSDSNRDRVGKMFELLAPSLDRFIMVAVEPELPDDNDWTQLVALKDAKKKGETRDSYDRLDPQVQLRVLTENVPHHVKAGWYPFDGSIGPTQRSYASELRDYRNQWAHMKAFSDDDAHRALDTAERLLKGIGAADVADEVQALRLELRRVTAEKDDRRTMRAAALVPGTEGLLPWREVLEPHEDVASGNYLASEFAADLYKVATGSPDAGGDYADPVTFFDRTYLTEGLRDLIGRAIRRLTGDGNAPPVINLQTNFGGGKTHSMLALWHLAAGVGAAQFGQELQELLAQSGYERMPEAVNRVALVGNHISASGTIKDDGTEVRTLWGELAWQLGGREAFEIVVRSDADGTNPGQALHELIAAYSPALILIDEWVAYARDLVGSEERAGGSFDTQFTFAQSLTEVVKGTPGVLLAISIPASADGAEGELGRGNAEEVGGSGGLQALKRLQNVVGRIADQWRPASADESYHIVRQRLFRPHDAEALAKIAATARRFCDFYRETGGEFPAEARDLRYEERIRHTYPVHPELFDRLYEDWSSLERFQRTRGVLRLMSTVIHALWEAGDASAMIMPASVPLADPRVNTELTQYLEDSWKAVIDADVDGGNSEPARIDSEKSFLGKRSVTKRLARTIFVGAAPTIGTSHKGVERQRVFLGTAVPGDTIGNFDSALNQLADRATYFYSGSGRYWYDRQANITRSARDLAERFAPEEVWSAIAERLEASEGSRRADFARLHVCPEETEDIPDLDEARLVILHPRVAHKKADNASSAMEFAKKATESRGGSSRTYRNMVVFLAADEQRLGELEGAVREFLGWSEILAKRDDLDLSTSQIAQAEARQSEADRKAGDRLLGAYQWALIPHEQPVEVRVNKVEGQATSLAERVARRLRNDGELATEQAGANIRRELNGKAAPLWEPGHVSLAELWATYAQYPYMPRLRDRSVLEGGLRVQPMLWQSEGFALAAGYDETTSRYRALELPSDENEAIVIDGETLLVKPERAMAQREADGVPAGEASSGFATDPGGDGTPLAPNAGPAGSEPADGGPPAKRRFFATKELSTERPAADFKSVTDEILAPLNAASPASLRIRIEIEATSAEGFEASTIRTVSENVNTLKFEQGDFEDA